ncbi:MAG: OsmC family protein [Thermoplasmata archaeon]
MKSRVDYKGSLIFDGNIRERKIEIDGNGETAPRPLEYLLTTLAACTSMSIVSILDRMHLEIKEMNTEVEGIQNDEPPKIFKSISIVYSIHGKVNQKQLEDAISLTMSKYSPTAVMLIKSGIDIRYSYEIKN